MYPSCISLMRASSSSNLVAIFWGSVAVMIVSGESGSRKRASVAQLFLPGK